MKRLLQVALYAKTMVYYLIHEYVSLADAKLLPVQLVIIRYSSASVF